MWKSKQLLGLERSQVGSGEHLWVKVQGAGVYGERRGIEVEIHAREVETEIKGSWIEFDALRLVVVPETGELGPVRRAVSMRCARIRHCEYVVGMMVLHRHWVDVESDHSSDIIIIICIT